MTPKDMKNEHAWNDLRDTLFHSKMYYQCWWYLAGAHEDRDFRLSAVGQEWLFFAAAESAFWESLISRLASIFDESPKSISFGSLDDLARHSTFKRTGIVVGCYTSIAQKSLHIATPSLLEKEMDMDLGFALTT